MPDSNPVANAMARSDSARINPGHAAYKSDDVADRLPERARDRLEALRDTFQAKIAYRREISDDLRAASDAKRQHEGNIHNLTRGRGHGGRRLLENDPHVTQQRQWFDEAAAKVKRLSAKLDANDVSVVGTLINRIEEFLERLPASARIIDVEMPKSRGKAPSLDTIAHDLAELDADRHEIESAPWPASAAKEAARRQVEALAEAGRPDASGLIDIGADARIKWPTNEVRLPFSVPVTVAEGRVSGAHGSAVGPIPNALAFMVWMNRDSVIAALAAEIDGLADDGAALDHNERRIRLEEIQAKRRELENTEAAVVWDSGDFSKFRPDISAEAVLSIEIQKG